MGDSTAYALVGRNAALAAIEAASAASRQSPSVVLVAGEAGIGKSFMVEQFGRQMRDVGKQVLIGGCLELAGDPIPYAPFAEVLRQVSQTKPGSIVRSDLRHIFGDHRGAQSGGRGALFERLLLLLEEIVGDSELVIVLEDMHWADQATLDLVAFLSRNLPRRLLLVLTYRDDELGVRPALQGLLGVIGRNSGTRRIDLGRLSRVELAMLAELVRGRAVPESELVRLFARSGGNPFIAQELLAADAQSSTLASVDEVLLARAGRLSKNAARVMHLVAIFERPVGHGLLEVCTDLDEEPLLAALRENVANGILTVNRVDEFTFRHVLTQQAVLHRLLPGERRRLHAEAAAAIQSQPDTGRSASRAAECATHWYLANDARAALPAAINAGRLAAEVYAWPEASLQFNRALELRDRVDHGADEHSTTRRDLLMQAAEAAEWNGAEDNAIDLASTALDLTQDPIAQAEILERISQYLGESGRLEEAQAAVERAHLLLTGNRPTALTAMVALARAFFLMAQYDSAAIPAARVAVDTAAAVGARTVEGRSRIVLGISLVLGGSPDDGTKMARQGHQLVSQWGDLNDRHRADTNYCHALLLAGNAVAACDVALAGVALLRRFGWDPPYSLVTANAINALRATGRWTEAAQLLDEALAADDLPTSAEDSYHVERPNLPRHEAEVTTPADTWIMRGVRHAVQTRNGKLTSTSRRSNWRSSNSTSPPHVTTSTSCLTT